MSKSVVIVVPFQDAETQKTNLARLTNYLSMSGAVYMDSDSETHFTLHEFSLVNLAERDAAVVIDQLPGVSDAMVASSFIKEHFSKSPVYLHATGDAANALREQLAMADITTIGFSRGGAKGELWQSLSGLLNSRGEEFSTLFGGLSEIQTQFVMVKALYCYTLKILDTSAEEKTSRNELFDVARARGLINEDYCVALSRMDVQEFVKKISGLILGFQPSANAIEACLA